jgi:hypothetical protein
MEVFKGVMYALLFTFAIIGVATTIGLGVYWFFK